MKKGILVLSTILIAIAFISAFWYFVLYSEKCLNIDCFNQNLVECSRANYLNAGEWSYQYWIKGIKEGECVVEVKLLFAGAEPRFNSLVDKSMSCSMPRRMIALPEENLAFCTGELKEKIQYLVIRDLYLYSAQNLGK